MMKQSSPKADLLLQCVVSIFPPVLYSDKQLTAFYRQHFEPFLNYLNQHEKVKCGIALSGFVLDDLSAHHPKIILKIKELYQKEQLEILTGLYYNGLPALLSEYDIHGQLQMTAEYWEGNIGSRPQGLWIDGCAIGHELPRLLRDSNITYTFVYQSQLLPAADHLQSRYARGVLHGPSSYLEAIILMDDLPAWHQSPDVAAWYKQAQIFLAKHPKLAVLNCQLPLWTSRLAEGVEDLAHWLDHLNKQGSLSYLLPRDSKTFSESQGALYSQRSFGALRDGQGHFISDAQQLIYEDLSKQSFYERLNDSSEKLRKIIYRMEDEYKDSQWSGKLATAQRHLYAAQSAALYTNKEEDPLILRHTLEKHRLKAEASIDSLLHEGKNWQEEIIFDWDHDQQAEIRVCSESIDMWLSTRSEHLMSAWLLKPWFINVFGAQAAGFRFSYFANETSDALGHDLHTMQKPWLNNHVAQQPRVTLKNHGFDEKNARMHFSEIQYSYQILKPLNTNNTASYLWRIETDLDKPWMSVSMQPPPKATTTVVSGSWCLQLPLFLGLQPHELHKIEKVDPRESTHQFSDPYVSKIQLKSEKKTLTIELKKPCRLFSGDDSHSSGKNLILYGSMDELLSFSSQWTVTLEDI